MSESLQSLHRKAMEHADAALFAKSKGDLALFETRSRLALDLEERAALMLSSEESSEPTRTILLRSAATLALRCNELERAERLAALALIGNGPHQLKEEVRDILEQVHFGRHLSLRGVQLEEEELQVSLSGSGVSFGMIAANQYLDRAKLIGNLLRRTAERRLGMPFQKHRGRQKDPFPVFLSVPRAASFAITYRLGDAQTLLQGMTGADDVLSALLDDIEYANSGDWVSLRRTTGSLDYYSNFLALLRQIAPDGEEIRLLGFTAQKSGTVRKVSFVKTRRDLKAGSSTIRSKQEMVVEGVLGAADRGSNFVRVGDARIRVPDGMIDDIVRPMWGQQVRAIIERRRQTASWTLKDVELLE